jgi:MFS family permease
VLSFRLACLTYLFVAVPGTTLGVLWPSARLDLHEPVGALGVVLVAGTAASVISSVVTGHCVTRLPVSLFVAVGTMLTAAASAVEALAGSLWVFTGGSVLFGIGFGAVDSALNAHAAHHFGPRNITWIHASYGLGAIVGPLLATGLAWRNAFWLFAAGLVVVGCVLAAAWPRQAIPRRSDEPASPLIIGSLVVAAVEAGIEAGAGVWGYLFLTSGRGLAPEEAGLAVSAYWAMMFVGRAMLGPVAERIGARVVLGWAVGGVAAGAALMMAPGTGVVALLVIGLAAAPIFPLLVLTSVGSGRAVGWQTAASAIGGAVVPAGMGLVIGASQAAVLAPMLLALSVAMCVVYVSVLVR